MGGLILLIEEMCGNFQRVGMVKINTDVEENNGRNTMVSDKIEASLKVQSLPAGRQVQSRSINELNITTSPVTTKLIQFRISNFEPAYRQAGFRL
jgi:hypothetical protein